LVVVATLLLPYTPLDQTFGFSPLPVSFILVIAAIVIVYIFTAEVAKRIFYRLTRQP
jgi:Mg2+-importing ATPase